MRNILLCFLSLIVICVTCIENTKVVEFPAGKVRGRVSEDGDVVTFKGIRFGKYPKRFTVSEVEDKLSPDIVDAFEYGAICPQSNGINLGAVISEDCLYLNIWAPNKVQGENKHQVMVYIHGGGFVQGGGNDIYVGGDAYAKRGAILVSLNYRLALFGFFAHPELTASDPENPTNFGLLDQVVALKWIKKYISYFGGNPEDITVFGESAGAASVQWLMAHKDHATQPLFTRAILQSSPASGYPFDLHEAEEAGTKFAETLGCVRPNILECLRGKDVSDIMAVVWDRKGLPSLSIPPTPKIGVRIASPHVDFKNFPVHPAISGIHGDAKSHNIIIGTTKDEWMLFVWLQHMFLLPSDEWMHETISLIFSSPHFVNQTVPKLGLSDRLEKLYPRHAYATGVNRVAAIFTDMNFFCPSRRYAQKLVSQGASVNFYLFSHEPIHGNQLLKAFHASELPFVFQQPVTPLYRGAVTFFASNFTAEEISLSSGIIDVWLNLGKQDKLVFNGSLEWPRFTADASNFLNLSVPASILQEKFQSEQCEFFEEITTVPQRQIVFDILAHEPFVLTLVNQYTLEFAMVLLKNKKATLVGLCSLPFLFYFLCCRRSKQRKIHSKRE